ncbi:DUF4175 family protein [Neptunitalea lumnitzerae]|nr:DUF4175 family protein [Neptunitalea sp. Y10]
MNELIKGIILFLAIGLCYFIFTLLVEHFLWLSSTVRMILFWVFIGVELFLFVKFIGIPIAYLLKLKRGIDNNQASKLIGAHFTEVDDKLVNLVQLAEDKNTSELLLASIDQKSMELSPIPFQSAINFKSSFKYAKYLLIPAIIILIIVSIGSFNWFTDSYTRVVNYSTYYEPPAPYSFNILNKTMNVEEGKPYMLSVKLIGDVLPDNVIVNYEGQEYFMKRTSVDMYEYTFTGLKKDTNFYLESNAVVSREYKLHVVAVPVVLNFSMSLDYPSYTGKEDEVIKSTGNALIPEGTKVSWKLETTATDEVLYKDTDTVISFEKDGTSFQFQKQLFQDSRYELSTNNEAVKTYESFNYSLNVLKDENPSIRIEYVKDSAVVPTYVVKGSVTDDYGISKTNLVYYNVNNPDDVHRVQLSGNVGNVTEFVSVFPDTIKLSQGTSYEFYYETYDNDPFHGHKRATSKVLSYDALSDNQISNELLKKQESNIKSLDAKVEKSKENSKELDQISQLQKEKKQLSYSDKEKVQNYLQKEQQEAKDFEKLTQELKENLEKFKQENNLDKETDKYLEERLERLQKKMEEEQKMLEEMEKYLDELSNEEMSKKLEEFKKEKNKASRDTKQMLELVKRYYVAQKTDMLGKELEELSKKQEALSEKSKDENTIEKQQEINEEFDKLSKELDELKKENEGLKKPMDIPVDKKDSDEVKKDQQEATENLEKSESDPNTEKQDGASKSAQKKQKSAAQKMKKMSSAMQGSLSSPGGEQMQEDIEMLRQILDNLLFVSEEQEYIEAQLSKYATTSGGFSKHLIRQQELKVMFEHVDDSLFALASRQPMISVKINDEIEEVYFNMDKSLETLAENNIYQGLSSQQYSLTHINNLADLLSDALNNMQMMMQMQASGSGQGNMPSPGQQLQDMIMSQQEMNAKMQGQMGGKDGEGKGKGEQKEGEGEKKDGKGKNGEKPGKEGKPGASGENGNGGNGGGEMSPEQVYEIYKQQQLLRQELEKQLEGKLTQEQRKNTQNTIRQMENVEEELLTRGITESVFKKMKMIEQQLIKLENAAFEQGQKEERESNTNTRDYNGNNENIERLKEYFEQVEILNRQVLPLRQFYKEKVNQYIKSND